MMSLSTATAIWPGRHQQRVVGRRLRTRHDLGQLVLCESGRDRKLIARLRDDRCQGLCDRRPPSCRETLRRRATRRRRGRMMMRWPTLRPRRSTRIASVDVLHFTHLSGWRLPRRPRGPRDRPGRRGTLLHRSRQRRALPETRGACRGRASRMCGSPCRRRGAGRR